MKRASAIKLILFYLSISLFIYMGYQIYVPYVPVENAWPYSGVLQTFPFKMLWASFGFSVFYFSYMFRPTRLKYSLMICAPVVVACALLAVSVYVADAVNREVRDHRADAAITDDNAWIKVPETEASSHRKKSVSADTFKALATGYVQGFERAYTPDIQTNEHGVITVSYRRERTGEHVTGVMSYEFDGAGDPYVTGYSCTPCATK